MKFRSKYLFNAILIIAVILITKTMVLNGSSSDDDAKISDITVLDNEGEVVNLSSYNGKVLLIVNVASECGYTKQYAGLQDLYEKYNDKGFEILAFPCNDFGGQEPGSNEEIEQFCTTEFGVTFKLFDKISVQGDDKAPLYRKLTDNSVTGTKEIGWNFEKFLIDKDGNIVKRFVSKVNPESEELVSELEKLLN